MYHRCHVNVLHIFWFAFVFIMICLICLGLFIICNKSNTEDDLRNAFQSFGTIEEINIVKDRSSGESKGIIIIVWCCNKAVRVFTNQFDLVAQIEGIAYVKFSKTSEAAAALEEMNGKLLGDANNGRPIKVLVAARCVFHRPKDRCQGPPITNPTLFCHFNSRNQGSTRSDNEQEKNVRLFVIISKETNEQKLTEEFQKFGEVDSVSIIRDKATKESKGFAYVKFFK